ncbi:hypothetical protein [Sphingomonas sp. ABOLG]|uniref:hypothetical protein n=1 Tax=Sphingomonas sp. ABOLG TaxID=1985880 RepID=UPI000F7E6F55|nr:hypothetical protein [Sphingomonas sp. ABOLG]
MTIGDALGAYGALLSSYLAIRQILAGKRRLSITAVPAYGSEQYPPVGRFTRVNIRNVADRPVHVRHVSIDTEITRRLKSRVSDMFRYRRFSLPRAAISHQVSDDAVFTPKLPTTIESGRSLVLWLPADTFTAFLKKNGNTRFAVTVQDEVDTSYRSAWFKSCW